MNVNPCLSEQVHVLTKCSNKFDCLIKAILFIKAIPKHVNGLDSRKAKYSLEEVVAFFLQFVETI